MRCVFGGRLFGALCPLRSTVDKSSGAALRALKGMALTLAPLAVVTAPPMRDRESGPSDMPPSVATRNVVVVAPVGGPPAGMKSTMVRLDGRSARVEYIGFRVGDGVQGDVRVAAVFGEVLTV